jgi:hypothetical protein
LILAASLIALAPSVLADDSYAAAESDNTEGAEAIQPDPEAASAGSTSGPETNAEEANSGEGNEGESRSEQTDSPSIRELDV